MIFISYK